MNVNTEDENLAIDNNRAEREVKQFAIGRKAYLFFGLDRGGRTLMILASFTGACGQYGINLWTSLRDKLAQLPATLLNGIAIPRFQINDIAERIGPTMDILKSNLLKRYCKHVS